MKSFAAASLFATLALAQTTSSPIPAGASEACKAYLTTMNSSPDLLTCTSALQAATAALGSSPSSSAMTGALSTLCSSATETACSQTKMQGILTGIQGACQSDMTSNPAVLAIYDTLYAISPMRTAMCSKSDSSAFCLTSLTSVHGDTSQSRTIPNGQALQTVQQQLSETVNGEQVMNPTTAASTNIAFLFLSTTMNANDLCTACTRNIFMAFVNFESTCPYGPGLGASPMLKNQPALYSSIGATCGASFLQSGVNSASGLSGGVLGGVESAASRSAGVPAAAVALGALVAGLAAASL